MSSLYAVVGSLAGTDNPFKASETDTEQLGFIALCAGAMVAINIILLSVALASRRRRPRRPALVPYPSYEPMPQRMEIVIERENPLHAKRAQREAERLAAEAAAKKAAPIRPARPAPPGATPGARSRKRG